LLFGFCCITRGADFKIATFQADVTIPMGHPCMGGGISPAKEVSDPLYAKGFVLLGAEKPLVLLSLDWCEVRGTSYDKWRNALAEAAGTEPSRVLVTSTHVHDAPVMDEDAEKILRDMKQTGAWEKIPPPDPKAPVQVASVCWPAFNEQCIARVVAALKNTLPQARHVTHLGTGSAKVDRIASNRRFLRPNGEVSYGRYSRSRSAEATAADEGTIDPLLRTLSFWHDDECLCAVHSYAVHPMSSYGAGKVSFDFPGLAREQMQKELPQTFQIFVNGCAGNVTAGKYNDGDPKNKLVFAGRLKDAMEEAMKATQRAPLDKVEFHLAQLPLGARNTPGHTETVLRTRIQSGVRPFDRSEAAMGLAWYERVKSGHKIEVPRIDFGGAQLMLLPAEAYVEYQLYAQGLRPKDFVLVMGYGECGPGYIPIERAWREHDENLQSWTWVGPGSEEIMRKAIREVMK
jgi:hypothetical protein